MINVQLTIHLNYYLERILPRWRPMRAHLLLCSSVLAGTFE